MASNFKLWLDTQAPSLVSMSINKTVGNTNSVTLSHSISDNQTQDLYQKVWIDTVASPTSPSGSWEAFSDTKELTFTSASNVSVRYYVHAMYMDSVGNISSIITCSQSYLYVTKSPSVAGLTVTDATSGSSTVVVGSHKLKVAFTSATFDESSTISAVIKDTTSNKTLYSGNLSDGAYSADFASSNMSVGTNTISVTVTDSAGNTSTQTATIIYDSEETSGTVFFGKSTTDSSTVSYTQGKLYGYLSTSSADIVSVTYNIKNSGGTSVKSGTVTLSSTTKVGSNYPLGNLTTGVSDGTYTIEATYTDTAGITGNLTSSTVISDSSAPTLTGSPAKNYWYANSSTRYPSPFIVNTFVEDKVSGLDRWKVEVNGTDISSSCTYEPTNPATSMEDATLSINHAFTQAQCGKTCTLTVWDKAGNSESITFNSPTWDASAPTCSATISDSAKTYNSGYALGTTTTPVKSCTVQDSGAGLKKVEIAWTQSTTSIGYTDITSALSLGEHNTSSKAITSNVNSAWSSTNANGTWYLYVRVTDNVNNSKAYQPITFIYDRSNPTVTFNWNGLTTTTSATNTINISGSDANTSVVKMKVYGDCLSDGDSNWVDYTTTRTVTFKPTEQSGTKTIYVQVQDTVGNVSTVVSTPTIEYVSNQLPTLLLLNTDGTGIGNPTKQTKFGVRIGSAVDDVSTFASYQLSGNMQSPDSTTTWHTFTPDSGRQYMTITSPAYSFTSGDGTKTIKVRIKNTAGEIVAVGDVDGASATTVVDTTPPTLNITGLDYNRISDKHTARIDNENKFNDQITFNFTYNEKLSAYKVCVVDTSRQDYSSQSASEDAVAIGTANGSVNMSGSTGSGSGTISCKICEADFYAHSLVDADGAYFIGVYGKDVAGTWSLIGTLAT